MYELAASNEKSKQECILLVDDDTLLVDTLNEGLSLSGYQCKAATSASMALELLSKNLFDTMIIDIVLPDISGFELTTKAKKIKPDMTIIIMTGHIDEFSYEDAIESGASDFIKKPFSLKELIARIEHAKMHERLHDISLHDELTGLYNRRGFFTLAEHLLKTAKRQQAGLFMLYCDLDGLKGINDALGHQKGDWALIDTANILKETFRDSDIIARIGGDEFVVMPIKTTGDNLEIVINRLQKAVEMDNTKSKREYKLSISIGTAYFDPLSPCTIDELLSQADKLMYEQKRSKQTA
ncbi:MAG: GGDEF domain-containing response regulator [Thermodesulfovibrionales bacterium]|jgi:diguanylate cyclase (GGDEF)-like protein